MKIFPFGSWADYRKRRRIKKKERKKKVEKERQIKEKATNKYD
jgi:hypothetical protein